MADTKTSVVITYSKPGTAPPIYLAGSFPESGWQPREMEYKNVSNDHYVFSKAVEVEEGKEYQYKFRIGDGDWWMSDEDAPIGMWITLIFFFTSHHYSKTSMASLITRFGCHI